MMLSCYIDQSCLFKNVLAARQGNSIQWRSKMCSEAVRFSFSSFSQKMNEVWYVFIKFQMSDISKVKVGLLNQRIQKYFAVYIHCKTKTKQKTYGWLHSLLVCFHVGFPCSHSD